MYTIEERQVLKNRLSDPAEFEADSRLFARVFPNHPLRRELQLVNNFNRARLQKQMVYALLQRVTEEEIVRNRAGEGRAEDIPLRPAGTSPKLGEESSKNNAPELGEESSEGGSVSGKRRTKQEEFPDIPWDENTEQGVQLCILLYDERVNTYHRMQEIDQELDAHPELAQEMAELDERNRQAQKELDTWQSTRRFAMVHPIVIQALQEEQQLAELKRIAREDPEEFMRRVTNAKQNLRRIESRLQKQQYKDETQRAQWERNREKAKRLLALMQQCI